MSINDCKEMGLLSELSLFTIHQIRNRHGVPFQPKPCDQSDAFRSDQTFVSEFFSRVNIRDMNFYNRCFDSCDGVMQRYGSMRVRASIENYSIEGESYFMYFVDKFSFYV